MNQRQIDEIRRTYAQKYGQPGTGDDEQSAEQENRRQNTGDRRINEVRSKLLDLAKQDRENAEERYNQEQQEREEKLLRKQFKSEGEYNAYKWQQKYKGKGLADIQRALNSGTTGNDEKAWLKNYMSTDKDFLSRLTSDELRKLKEDADASAGANEKQLTDLMEANGYFTPEDRDTKWKVSDWKRQLNETLANEYADQASKDQAQALLDQIGGLEEQWQGDQARSQAFDWGGNIAERKENIENKWGYLDNDPEFHKYAEAGAKMENPSVEDVRLSYMDDPEKAQVTGGKDFRVSNPVTYYLQHKDDPAAIDDRIIIYGNEHGWDKLEQDELDRYNAIRYSRGADAGMEYMDDLQIRLSERGYNERMSATENQYANAGVAGKLGMNALAAGANAWGGLAAAFGDAKGIADGNWDPYNQWRTMQDYGSKVVELTSQDISDSINDPFWSAIAANTYSGIHSGISSAIGAATFGKGYTAVMGAGAASQRARELYESGASDGQIAAGAIASGVIEAAFEDISLDKYMEQFVEGDITGVLDFLKKTGIQGFVEGSEEFNTEIANMVANSMILGYNSDNQREMRDLIEQGMTTEQAKRQVQINAAVNTFWAFYGGAVSGAGMAATGGLTNQIAKKESRYQQAGQNVLESGGKGDLVEAASADAKLKSLAAKVAGISEEKYNEKGAIGQYLDNRKTGKLYDKLADSQTKSLQNSSKQAFRESAIEALDKKGIKAGGTLVDVLEKSAYGEKLSRNEQKLLNEFGGKGLINEIVNSDVFQQREAEATKADSDKLMETMMTQAGGKSAFADSGEQVESSDFKVNTEGKTLVTKADGSTIDSNVIGVESTGSKGLKFRVEGVDGSVDAKDISFASKAEQTTAYALSMMDVDSDTATALMTKAAMTGKGNSGFGFGIRELYQMGRNGVSFSSVNLDSIDNARGIDSSAARLAFDAGRSAYLAETAKAEEGKHARAASQKKAAGKHINETNGVEYSSNIKVKKTGDQVTAITVTDKNGNAKDITLNARQKAGIQAAEMLASMGLNVHVFLSQTDANGKPIGENGSYSMKDGSIHIDLNAGSSGQGVMAYTIAHELTHFMEQQSPKLFQQFTDALFASVDMDVEAEIAAKAEKLRQQRPDAYRNASKQKLMDDARSEVVAECCETMLTDTDAAERIARNIQTKDKTLWEKVVQWFRDLGNRMREAYNGLDPDSQIAKDAKKTIQQVDSLVQMWADMAVDAAENYRNAEAASNSNLSDGTMLSITRTKAMSWGQQIRSLLNGNGKVKHMDTLVAMNNTPQYLKNDGVQDLPLAIPISVITKSQNEKNGSHKVSDQNLIALRYGMDNSIAVIDNPGRNSLAFITPLTEIVGEETENVCAFFDKNAVFDNDKVHRATSIHSRADISGMLDKLSDDAVIYVKNKNEFESLVGMADSIPAAYKSKIKFVSDNVAQDDGTVKRSERDSSEKEITELQQFKRWFGASKIVDETGAPKVLYHQTNADFTIFDTHHEGAGSRDQDTPFGIFMKESNANIGLRGEKQMALYAKIENPIVVQDREDLMHKLRKLSSEYAEISKEHRRLDDDYHARYEEATETLKQYMHDWRREHPNASRKALWDDAEFVRLYDAEHNVLDEWEAEARKIETHSKEVITSALEDAGYDGVIIKNDKGSFGRSTDAYIALHPEQVKSATDNIGTFDINNPDIRFSDRMTEDIANLKELVKLQGTVTEGKIARPETLTTAANAILKDAMRTMDAKDKPGLIRALEILFHDANTPEMSATTIEGSLMDVAAYIDRHSQHNAPLDDYAANALNELKGKKIRLDETQKAEIRSEFGSMNEFRKRIAGTIQISDSGTMTMEDLWQDMRQDYSMLFNEDARGENTSAANLPSLLVENIDRLRDMTMDKESADFLKKDEEQIAWDVLNNFRKIRRLYTVADRNAEQVAKLNKEHEAAMREVLTEKSKLASELRDTQRAWDEEAEAMEFTHKQAMEEAAAEHKQELKELAEKLKHDAAEELAQVLDEHAQGRKAAVENRRRTEGRQKIQKLAEKFRTMATEAKKTPTGHAPVQLMNSLIQFCELFQDQESHALEYASNNLKARELALGEQVEVKGWNKTRLKERDAIARQKERLAKKAETIALLQQQYAKLEGDPTYQMFHDDHTQLLVDDMSKQLAGTDIYDMSYQQLENLYRTMQELHYTITNANKVFAMGKDKTLIGVAQKMSSEINQANVSHGKVQTKLRQYNMWQMTPDTFFNYICGYIKNNEGIAVQKMMSDGQARMMEVQRSFAERFRPLLESKDKDVRKYIETIVKHPTKNMIDVGLKDMNGNTVKLSKGMAIQAYMLLMQKDSYDSLIYSGFKLPNADVYYDGKTKEAYGNMDEGQMLTENISESYQSLIHEIQERQNEIDDGGLEVERVNELTEEINDLRKQAMEMAQGAEARLIGVRDKIAANLTAEDHEIIKTAMEWYKYTGQLMTDVYLQMYGYKPQLVDGYVPIHRDLDSVKLELREGQEDKAFNLENSGFTKERVKSRAPILLTDVFHELQNQSNQIARYYGFAQAQKDLNRILNVRVGAAGTIRGKIAAKYGSGNAKLGVSGQEYINHYIRDLAGSGGQDQGVFDWLYGASASATLAFNPRVALSQAASIPTASAVVGWKSMAVGFAKGIGTSVSTAKKNQLDNDSIWFWQRHRGGGAMTELADLQSKGGMWSKIANSKAGKFLYNWCQGVDVFSTASMWAMAEDYVQTKHKGIDKSSAEYRTMVEQTYADIIRKSQPNYTTTERSDMLRDKRNGMKLLTMYKTQSNQNLNILLNATGEFNRMKVDFANKRNGVTKADVDAARAKLANAYTSVTIGGTLVFVLLRFAANIALGKVEPYKDEDGKLSAEGIAKGLAKEAMSSVAGMFALGGQLYDYLYSAMSGDKYYGISDTAIGNLNDVLTNTQKVFADILDKDKDLEFKTVEKALSSLAITAGVPLNNTKAVVDAARMWYTDLTEGTLGEFTMPSNDTSASGIRKSQEGKLLKAVRNGDKGKAGEVIAKLAAGTGENVDSKVEAAVRKNMRTYLKELYLKDKVTAEEVHSIMDDYLGEKKDNTDKKLREWQGIIDTGYTESEAQDAYLDGTMTTKEYTRYLVDYMSKDQKNAEAAELKLRIRRDEGMTVDDITDYYVDGKITKAKASELLVKYAGKNPANADTILTREVWKNEIPNFNERMENSWIEKYANYQNTGLSRSTYYKMWEWRGLDSKNRNKQQTINYIDQLNIPDSQKHALWMCFRGSNWRPGGKPWARVY